MRARQNKSHRAEVTGACAAGLIPEIRAGGAELAEQEAADVVAVVEGELVQAGAGEAVDGGVVEPRGVQPEAPQGRVARQQRAEQVVRQHHLLVQPTCTQTRDVNQSAAVGRSAVALRRAKVKVLY